MPWWKQGSGYSERGRKDRRLSMSERPLAWPIQLGSAASVLLGSPPSCVKPFLPPGSWLRCALVTSVMTMGLRLPAVLRPCYPARGNGRL